MLGDPAFQLNPDPDTDPVLNPDPVQATSTSKDEIYQLFSIFLGNFCPPGSGSSDPINPDPIRIRIYNKARKNSEMAQVKIKIHNFNHSNAGTVRVKPFF